MSIGDRRELKGIPSAIATVLSAIPVLFVFYTAFRGTFPTRIQVPAVMMFMIPLVLIYYPGSKKAPIRQIPISDIIMAILAALSFAWMLWDYNRILYRIKYVSPVTSLDMLFGIMAIFFVIEATRRTLGWILVVTTLVLVGYTFFGPYIPGILGFKAFPFPRFIEQMYLVPEGLFSTITVIASTYLFTFVAFGSFLRASGIHKYYMDLALALAGKSRGGPAKVAVMSSGLMGTLTGSTISNLVTTGSLSIPMMKETGFKPREAAAIETAASTGGALTPPLMGAGVFVMSAITGIPVVKILVYSIIPAIMYFFSLYIVVDIKARKYGLKGLPSHKLPSLITAIKSSFHLFIPLVILIFLLATGYSPFFASASSAILIFLFSFLKKETRMGPIKMIRSVEETVKNMMPILAVSACAACIMGVITLTGLTMKFTSVIIAFSHGITLLALFLLMGVSYILGMGLPITLSYILVAALGAPALVELGVPLMAAHLAIFWYSQDSTITPPICMTAFVAAEMAGEKDFMKVGISTVKIAKALYLVPLFFVFTPLVSENAGIVGPLKVFVQSLPLFVLMAVLTEGFLLGHLRVWEWFLTGISAISFGAAVFLTNFTTILSLTLLGLSTTIIVFYSQKIRIKSSKANPVL